MRPGYLKLASERAVLRGLDASSILRGLALLRRTSPELFRRLPKVNQR
jgi:hypothetical protein